MSARRGDNRAAQLGARAAGTQIKLTGPPDERTGSCLSRGGSSSSRRTGFLFV